MSVQRVLVTGGNGYLGSVLIEHLIARGLEVHALANRNRSRLDELLPGSQVHALGDDYGAIEALVARLCPDVIFHLAGVYVEPATMDAAATMIGSNLTFGTALLRGAALCEPTPIFLNTGTYWQFGEKDSFSPNTFYAATKQAFMDLINFFEKYKGLRATTLILFDTFGLEDPRPKLWTKILHAPHGAEIALTEGRQFIDLVHVNDVASAFLHAAELIDEGQRLEPVYAVRGERRITLRELIESFNVHAGTELQFDWGAVPYWPGQIFVPWHGPLLPGWRAETCIDTTVADYLRERSLQAEAAERTQVGD